LLSSDLPQLLITFRFKRSGGSVILEIDALPTPPRVKNCVSKKDVVSIFRLSSNKKPMNTKKSCAMKLFVFFRTCTKIEARAFLSNDLNLILNY
jgi:hypothetical protein